MTTNLSESNVTKFGENGLLYIFKHYFVLLDKSHLNFCWIFISEHFDKYLCLNGKCKLTIINGTININGVDFSSPFKEYIYSPCFFAKITIRPSDSIVDDLYNLEDSISYLIEYSISSDKSFLKSFPKNESLFPPTEKWTILKLTSFSCSVINDVVQFNEFRHLFNIDKTFPFADKFKFSITYNSEGAFNVTKEMKETLDIIMRASFKSSEIRVIFVGQQNCGKSSFLRILTNKLLSAGHKEVCIIDGDPGQSEFSTCGSLSLTIVTSPLFGPPFTHQFSRGVSVIEQYFMGFLSPNDDPFLYCRSFERLYHKYLSLSEERPLPLIINTMGWVQGIGLSLLLFKFHVADPTHILQLKAAKPKRDLSDLTPKLIESLTEREGDQFIQVKSKITSKIIILKSPVMQNTISKSNFKPKFYRDLTMLSYLLNQTRHRPICFDRLNLPAEYSYNPVFRLRSRVPSAFQFFHPSRNLATHKPVDGNSIVHLKEIYSKLIDDNNVDSLLECFHVQWVGLCRKASPSRYKSLVDQPAHNHSGRGESGLMRCLGMGLVSYVRTDSCEIDLLAGVDLLELDGCFVIKSKLQPPDCIFTNQDARLRPS